MGELVVGEIGSELDYQKLSETSGVKGDPGYYLVVEKCMASMPLWLDSDFENTVYGFSVSSIEVDNIDQDWIDALKAKAKAFEEITGVKAKLIGTQNIW